MTAGFDPNGGGFAQYVQAMPWVAQRGMLAIPNEISFEEATFIEPVNTCIKAVEKARVSAGETVLVMGQGPIGLLLMMLSKLAGAFVIGSDPMPERRAKSVSLGADLALDPRDGRIAEEIRSRTEGRGADAVLVAVPLPAALTDALGIARPGGRILLFAQNDPEMRIEFPAAAVGVAEKEILGSYSAAVDRQEEAARLIFSRQLPVRELISHRFSLEEMNRALELAAHPSRRFFESGDTALIRSENNKQRNGHMTAAVLYGSENLKIENVDIPTLAPDEALHSRKSGVDLRHGPESLEAGIPRANDYSAGRFRPRACRHCRNAGRRCERRLESRGARRSVELRAMQRLLVLPQGTNQSLRRLALQQWSVRGVHPHSRAHRPPEHAGDSRARFVSGCGDGRTTRLRVARHS